IAAIALTRVAVGMWKVRSLRRSFTPGARQFTTNGTKAAKTSTNEDVRLTTSGRGDVTFGRQVQVSVSDRVTVPTAVGFFRPMVILPAWTVDELSLEELNAVVLHEMAHLRRWDDWSNLAQKVIRALFFFHPAVWWIDNRLTLEREMACDDLVLAETSNPRAYAECLVSLAEKNFLRRGLAMAQAAVGRIQHMSLRVARILDHQRTGATRVWKPAMGLLAVLATASVVAFTRSAPLVGFEDSAAPVTATSAEVHVPSSMVVQAGLHEPAHASNVATQQTASAAAQHGNREHRAIPVRTRNVRTTPQVIQAK